MKVAYIFRTNMASTFQLSTMILPQLETNTHLVNVLGMFFFDDNISNISSMEKSEILITDNSGIMLEFGLVLNRPCLCFNEEQKIHNVDFKSLNIESLEEIFIKNFTKELKNVEVDNIEEHYLNTLKNYDNLKPRIIIFREKYISNLNNSVDAAFDYLTSIKLNK